MHTAYRHKILKGARNYFVWRRKDCEGLGLGLLFFGRIDGFGLAAKTKTLVIPSRQQYAERLTRGAMAAVGISGFLVKLSCTTFFEDRTLLVPFTSLKDERIPQFRNCILVRQYVGGSNFSFASSPSFGILVG